MAEGTKFSTEMASHWQGASKGLTTISMKMKTWRPSSGMNFSKGCFQTLKMMKPVLCNLDILDHGSGKKVGGKRWTQQIERKGVIKMWRKASVCTEHSPKQWHPQALFFSKLLATKLVPAPGWNSWPQVRSIQTLGSRATPKTVTMSPKREANGWRTRLSFLSKSYFEKHHLKT